MYLGRGWDLDDADAVLSYPEPRCSVIGAQDDGVFAPCGFSAKDRAEHDPEEQAPDHDGGHPRDHEYDGRDGRFDRWARTAEQLHEGL